MVDQMLSYNTLRNTTTQPSSVSTVEQSDIPVARQRSRISDRMFQNFFLILLDSNTNEPNDSYDNLIKQLHHIVNIIDRFSEIDDCIDFLTEIKHEKIFMIVSGTLSQHIVPLIHDIPQLHSIYILCDHTVIDKEWTKVKGISTQIVSICDSLKEATQQYDQNLIPITFLSLDDALNLNVNQLNQSFMYSQILKEILFEIKYNIQIAVKNLVAYFRDKDPRRRRSGEDNIFDRLEREYHLQSPIWWYTSQPFIYSMVNHALRTQEIDEILLTAFFLHDLHKNIEQLYTEQRDHYQMQPLIVYRGQGLTKEDFEQMISSKGGLMSFNNFLSTSTDRNVAFTFADSIQCSTDLIGILFEMTIDTSMSSSPFANLDNAGQFNEEKEILFSMHTIFRIGEIESIQGNNRFWQVKLTLTNDNDTELDDVTNKIREETQTGSTGEYRLGKLLIKLGEYDKAKQVYEVMLDFIADDLSKEHIYGQLGLINSYEGNYRDAVSFYERSIEIHQKLRTTNDSNAAHLYNNFGLLRYDMGDYSAALDLYQQVLQIEEKLSVRDHFLLACIYNNIALAYADTNHHSEAFEYYEKSLHIYQRIFPSHHPYLALSYNNIGLVSHKMGQYANALEFYEKGLEISQRTLPLNHPHLVTIYNNIGGVYENMGECSKALFYHEEALKIRQKILPSNHLDLAISYDNIGSTYRLMDDYSRAIDWHKKALAIGRTIIPSNDLFLVTCYINTGNAYLSMGEYLSALSFYKEALEIREHILPFNHPDFGLCYNNIGCAYFSIKDYSNALSFYEQALDIYRRTLPFDHFHFVQCYDNIAALYHETEAHTKALQHYEKALEIRQRILPSNHLELANSYTNIGTLYKNLQEYSKALSYYEQALEIGQMILSLNHLDLANYLNNIGSVYESMNEHSKALAFFQRTFDIAQQSLPSNHPQLQVYRGSLESSQNSVNSLSQNKYKNDLLK